MFAGIKRNIVSLQFMGINVFKPRCAIPIGNPCVPLEGPSRRLAEPLTSLSSLALAPHGRSLEAASDDSDDITLPFDVRLYTKEQLIFRVEQTQRELGALAPELFQVESC